MFAVLIDHGHRRDELPGYTLRQLRLFFKEAMKLHTEQLQILALSLGVKL